MCHRLVGREQPAVAFVQQWRGLLPAQPNIVEVNHARSVASLPRAAPRKFQILFLRSSGQLDSLISSSAARSRWREPTGCSIGDRGRKISDGAASSFAPPKGARITL